MQTITQLQKKTLKAEAHNLNPIIIIGDKGLTENVIKETDRALVAHELIKVRINAADRNAKKEMAVTLATACEAAVVNMIGHIAILYRESKEKKQEEKEQNTKSKGRSPKSKSESRRPKPEAKKHKPDNRRSKPEAKGQKPESRRQKAETKKPKPKARGDRR